MNKIIKTKWVKALRSGKYKQGKGALKKNGNFCCLGVLCDLYIKEYKTAKWEEKEFPINKRIAFLHPRLNIEEDAVLPMVVSKWAGLRNNTSPSNIKTSKGDLTDLNDTSTSFKRIATIIEKEL